MQFLKKKTKEFYSLFLCLHDFLEQHPHLYERAFIDRNLGGKFTSAADLWSLGATLAHAVLGEVPFRPFEGSRKNRNEMYIETVLLLLILFFCCC